VQLHLEKHSTHVLCAQSNFFPGGEAEEDSTFAVKLDKHAIDTCTAWNCLLDPKKTETPTNAETKLVSSRERCNNTFNFAVIIQAHAPALMTIYDVSETQLMCGFSSFMWFLSRHADEAFASLSEGSH
jgi:hypothetical protein